MDLDIIQGNALGILLSPHCEYCSHVQLRPVNITCSEETLENVSIKMFRKMTQQTHAHTCTQDPQEKHEAQTCPPNPPHTHTQTLKNHSKLPPTLSHSK